MCVPQHVADVVVTVGAQRLADNRRVLVVDVAAADGTRVFAGSAVAAGATPVTVAVNRPEGWGGEGDEETRPVADCGGDVLAAEQACADQMEGVAGVETGAGRADGCASVAAADEEAFAGFVAGVVVVEDLTGHPGLLPHGARPRPAPEPPTSTRHNVDRTQRQPIETSRGAYGRREPALAPASIKSPLDATLKNICQIVLEHEKAYCRTQ